MLTPDLVLATTKCSDHIKALIDQYRQRPPGPKHRADMDAVVRPRATHGKHRGRTHYGTPLDDMHEEWRAAHRNRAPRHRSRAFDITRSANA